jgi:hypothetical protein
MTDEELIQSFCKYCQRNPRFVKFLRTAKFGTKEDAFYNLRVMMPSLISDYRNNLVEKTNGFAEYLKARKLLEGKMQEFIYNILHTLKNVRGLKD